jgi:hypothetical protein
MTIMTDTQTRAEKIAEMSEPQLIRLHSKNMREIEAVLDEAIRRLDARQSEQRTGQAAQDLAELRALKCDLMAYHNRMDAFAVRLSNAPVARSGER